MKIRRLLSACAGLAAPLFALAATQEGTPVTVYNFCSDYVCKDGAANYPAGSGSLVQGANGVLYGTTWGGGQYGEGTIFGVATNGKRIALYEFCATSGCPDGSAPWFGLTLATDGNIYGVTTAGGANASGTVFRITRQGKFTTIYSFCAVTGCADGSIPYAGLIQASNGALYGTTRTGGAYGKGTVFKITLGGKLTSIYSFTGGADGGNSWAPVVQASDDELYGTTYYGGASGHGTIFKITLGGKLTTLHNFAGLDGGASAQGLIVASDGNLYGTSKFGGTPGAGTVFKLTPAGVFTTLYSFSNADDGAWPNSALTQGSDGNLYGTTEISASANAGTIYRIGLDGTFSTLSEFGTAYAGFGNSIYAGLVQATNGQFYGVTEHGGTKASGTLYRFTMGLGPFVQTLPSAGAIGSSVKLLGSHFEDAISVTFNGAPAAFAVISGTEIAATIPAGATSGIVQVTTAEGTLSSNTVFQILAAP